MINSTGNLIQPGTDESKMLYGVLATIIALLLICIPITCILCFARECCSSAEEKKDDGMTSSTQFIPSL